ncbi:hypothetical protein ACHAWF_011765 [Thalassiosira exigua]
MLLPPEITPSSTQAIPYASIAPPPPLLIPTSTFHSSSTAGQTNHIAPADNGTTHPAIRGTALDLAQRNIDAVRTEPKIGTGMGCTAWKRACSIVDEKFDWGLIGGRQISNA